MRHHLAFPEWVNDSGHSRRREAHKTKWQDTRCRPVYIWGLFVNAKVRKTRKPDVVRNSGVEYVCHVYDMVHEGIFGMGIAIPVIGVMTIL